MKQMAEFPDKCIVKYLRAEGHSRRRRQHVLKSPLSNHGQSPRSPTTARTYTKAQTTRAQFCCHALWRCRRRLCGPDPFHLFCALVSPYLLAKARGCSKRLSVAVAMAIWVTQAAAAG